MHKIITVVGPTSSGKSDLAVHIAKKFNGEVISADSRQVYRGLDIGSGKITKEEMEGVPHHLLDVEDPKNIFTVANFKEQAEQKIEEIVDRGKLPIIAGGTGFYIDALIHDMSLPEVPPNEALREKLDKQSVEELLSELEEKDPDRAETVDRYNKPRLIRALEIVEALGKVPALKTSKKYEVLQIGIKTDDLRERIHTRLLKRINEGMIEEVKNLGLLPERLEQLGLEYRYISRYLQGQLSKEEMIDELEIKITQFSKRQKTWFKRDPDIMWFYFDETNEIYKEINKFFS